MARDYRVATSGFRPSPGTTPSYGTPHTRCYLLNFHISSSGGHRSGHLSHCPIYTCSTPFAQSQRIVNTDLHHLTACWPPQPPPHTAEAVFVVCVATHRDTREVCIRFIFLYAHDEPYAFYCFVLLARRILAPCLLRLPLFHAHFPPAAWSHTRPPPNETGVFVLFGLFFVQHHYHSRRPAARKSSKGTRHRPIWYAVSKNKNQVLLISARCTLPAHFLVRFGPFGTPPTRPPPTKPPSQGTARSSACLPFISRVHTPTACRHTSGRTPHHMSHMTV